MAYCGYVFVAVIVVIGFADVLPQYAVSRERSLVLLKDREETLGVMNM